MKCIETLSKVHQPWANSAILSLLGDSSVTVRLAVINALSSTKQENILDNVASLLTDRDKRIRRATVQLFWQLDSDTFFGLNEGDIIIRLPEEIQITLFKDLLDGLRTGSDEYRKFAAFWLAIHHYEPSFEVLLNNLHHPSPEVQLRVILSLGIFGNQQAIEHLIPFIYQNNEVLQKKAIESIGSLGLDGLHALVHELFLKSDTNPIFLEKHVISFGGRVLNYITHEIERETDVRRKHLLRMFYHQFSQIYEVKTSNDFKILL